MGYIVLYLVYIVIYWTTRIIYFSAISSALNRIGAQMFHLVRVVGKVYRYCCWEKQSFMLIHEFKYSQSWKIGSSPFSSSICNTFNPI